MFTKFVSFQDRTRKCSSKNIHAFSEALVAAERNSVVISVTILLEKRSFIMSKCIVWNIVKMFIRNLRKKFVRNRMGSVCV